MSSKLEVMMVLAANNQANFIVGWTITACVGKRSS